MLYTELKVFILFLVCMLCFIISSEEEKKKNEKNVDKTSPFIL